MFSYKNYGSLVATPSANFNRFELPVINVKEVSPRLLNRYRDKRGYRNHMSVSVDLTRGGMITPMRADGECTNSLLVRAAARYEAEQSGDYSGHKQNMISIQDMVRGQD